MGLSAFLSTQVIDTTTVGRSVMTATDAAAARTALGLSVFGTIAVSGQSNVVADQANDTLTLGAGTNVTITTDASTDTITINCTASGLSGTGSVDNAVLRADGTGGSTLQSSAIVIDDLYTSSPNATVNFVCVGPTGGTTNVGLALKPKGTGPLTAQVPDSTATGGNARGANACDLQTLRSTAAQVASGAAAFTAGENNTASGSRCVAIGYQNTASGNFAFAATYNSTASGQQAVATGGATASNTRSWAHGQSTASAVDSVAFGDGCQATAQASHASGTYAIANQIGMRARTHGYFAAGGDQQSVGFTLRNKTTSAVATELFLDGSSTRLSIASGKVLSALVRVTGVKSDGSEVIKFLRDVTIKNVGGTTSLEAAVTTIGTDINVSGATLDLSADNTNDTLKIAVTPPTGTWRWAAIVEVAQEMAYGV